MLEQREFSYHRLIPLRRPGAAVQAARFAPLGHRGVNPYTRAAGYNASPGWFADVNSEVALMLMVEGKGGVAALREIIDTPGIDAIFVGPFDLSQAIGVPGQVDHPSVLSAIESIVSSTSEKSLKTAIYAPTPVLAKRWLNLGVHIVAVGYDTAIVLEAFRSVHVALAVNLADQ